MILSIPWAGYKREFIRDGVKYLHSDCIGFRVWEIYDEGPCMAGATLYVTGCWKGAVLK
jgi:hypothetical protein